eukprot:4597378-Lingulodinium_polyedra.AAC.1
MGFRQTPPRGRRRHGGAGGTGALTVRTFCGDASGNEGEDRDFGKLLPNNGWNRRCRCIPGARAE